MTRQTKTPKQRAEELLGVAERKVKRLRAEERNHRDALATTITELEAAVVRRDYLAAHPDLGTPSTPPADKHEEKTP